MQELFYELDAEDYIDYQQYYYKNSQVGKTVLKKVRGILGGCYLFGAVGIFALMETTPIKIAATLFLLLIGGYQILTYGKVQDQRIRKAVLKMLANNQAKETLGPKKISVQNGQLIYSENGVEQHYKAFKKLGETKRCYFLFKDDVNAIIVPKSAFLHTEERGAFLGEIQTLIVNSHKNSL